MAAEQHGYDFSGVDDIDFNLSLVSGRRALAESILRRLSTRRGTLLDDPSYGDDMRLLIGKPVDESEIEQRVLAQAFADERVRDAQAVVSLLGEDISIQLTIFDREGPFQFVVAISRVTVDLLEFTE